MTMKELAEKLKAGKPLTEAERTEARVLMRAKITEATAKLKARIAKREETR